MENGCTAPECYWWYFENANPQVGEIRPDYYTPFTFENYYNGVDEILVKIEELENKELLD